MQQDAYDQMKAAQQNYKGVNEKKICNAPQSIHAGQYVYIDRPQMTVCCRTIGSWLEQ